jgi:hypothetical protein
MATPSLPVGSVLGESLQFLGRQPTAVAALCAGQILFSLLLLPTTQALQAQAKAGDFSGFGGSWALLLLASTVYTSIVYALFIRYVADAWDGPPPSLGDTLRAGARRAPALLGVSLLLGLTLFVGFLLCVVPGLFLSVALCLAPPLTVLQPAGPFASLSGAWRISRAHWGNLFVVLVVCGGVLILVGLFGALLNVVLGNRGMGGLVVATVLTQLLNGAAAALLMTVLTHGYLRLSGRWWLPTEAR